MENLNKKNYFTEEWKTKYPKASEAFCSWIDQYKKDIDWDSLFNGAYIDEAFLGYRCIKFHELPLEMQYGILSKFVNVSCGFGCWLSSPPTDWDKLFENLNFYFGILECKLTGVHPNDKEDDTDRV